MIKKNQILTRPSCLAPKLHIDGFPMQKGNQILRRERMPLIRVVYRAAEYGFDYVTSDLLDTLITQDVITHFYRASERRWINIGLDPVRGSGGGYQGPERRGKDNSPKSIREKGHRNAEALGSDCLDGLWQVAGGHDAPG